MNLEITIPSEEEIIVQPRDFYDLLEKEIYIDIILGGKKARGKAYEVVSRGFGCMEAYLLGDVGVKWYRGNSRRPIKGNYIMDGYGMNDPRKNQPTHFVGVVYPYNPKNNILTYEPRDMILTFTERISRKVKTLITFERN